jgi:hypothetical protein
MQLRDRLLALVWGLLLSLKDPWHSIQKDPLPLRHQQRMHLVLSRNLRRCFDSHQRLKANFGLQGSTIPSALLFHGTALSHIEQSSKSLA